MNSESIISWLLQSDWFFMALLVAVLGAAGAATFLTPSRADSRRRTGGSS